MLAAIQNPKDAYGADPYNWGLTVSGIQDAWHGLKHFCSSNPDQRQCLNNLREALNGIRDKLTSSDPDTNPLVKGAGALNSLMTKMAAAGLTDRNDKPIKAPQWDATQAS